MNRRFPGSRWLLAALIAVSLSGCVVAPPPERVVVREEVLVRTPPPPPQGETPPPPPLAHAYWVGGHWNWTGHDYDWVAGHWVEPRPNEVWVPARWVPSGGGWVFRPGHWAAVQQPPEVVDVLAPMAPPPPRVEVITTAPGADFFWVAGVWRWEGGRHVWVAGHWEPHRAGQVWVPHHWVQAGGSWHLRGGFWMHG
jgi:hypothetical protein